MTQAEVSRWVDRHDREHENLVERREFDLVVRQFNLAITELQETNKWLIRLVITQLATLAIGGAFWVMTELIPNLSRG
jgi:hypothetical protein